MRYEILKMMLEIDFFTVNVLDVVLSSRIGHVIKTVHISRLHTIANDAAVLEKTGG